MTGISALVANDGVLPASSSSALGKKDSPRKRGIKQGAFLIFLTLLVVPLLVMFHVATGTEPFLAVAAAILLVGGGLLRTVWALLFESGEPRTASREEKVTAGTQSYFSRKTSAPALPGSRSIPTAVYTSPETDSWRDTNDLATPGSVTDSTTKLLSKEKDVQ